MATLFLVSLYFALYYIISLWLMATYLAIKRVTNCVYSRVCAMQPAYTHKHTNTHTHTQGVMWLSPTNKVPESPPGCWVQFNLFLLRAVQVALSSIRVYGGYNYAVKSGPSVAPSYILWTNSRPQVKCTVNFVFLVFRLRWYGRGFCLSLHTVILSFPNWSSTLRSKTVYTKVNI
jgi:hypothetical protein